MTPDAWLVIVLAGAGTYLIRLSFLAVAERATDLPLTLTTALKMIPAAAMAALTVPAIVRTDGVVDLASPRVVAGVLAAAVAVKTRNTIATLVVGMGSLAVLQQVWT